MRHVLLVSLLVAGCGDSGPSCDQESCVLQHTFPVSTLASGEERDGICQSWTLDNPTELWVNRVEFTTEGSWHHSNWFFVPDNNFARPDDAPWNCEQYDADELTAAILGGYLFAQSTQVDGESQSFAGGAAVRIPPWSRVVGFTHMLNASDAEVTTWSEMTITTTPADQVAVKLTPSRIEYHDLRIDPMAQSSFTTDCDVATTYQQVMGAPLQLTLFHMLPHYHGLGAWAELQIAGGPRDGEVLHRHDGYGEALGHTFDPPFDLVAAGGTGLRYTCGFLNDRSEVVGWGIGDQEMCVTALFSGTDMAFEAAVDFGADQIGGTADDGTILHSGPCGMFGLPWSHDKPGGPDR